MKIRNLLFLIFLLIGVIFVLTFSILTYYQGKKILLNEIYENLEAHSQIKKINFEGRRELQLDKVNIVSSRILLTEQELEHESKRQKKQIDSILKEFTVTIQDFKQIDIISKNGKVLNSSNSDEIINDKRKLALFSSRIKNHQLNDEILTLNKDKKLRIINGIPLLNQQGDSVAYLFIEFSTEGLLGIVNDYTALGNTGETMVLKPQEGYALNILPTRFDKSASLRLKVPYEKSAKRIQVAPTEFKNIYEMTDYRNKKVIVSIRKIDNLDWFLISKMDRDEIYSNIYPLRNFLLLFNLAFFIASFLLAYYLGKYLAKPIEELIVSTNKIKDGDLKTRVTNKYTNELGQLSESFNTMADKLERKINDLDKVGFVISHDLKAPLNSIIPLTDFIKEENSNNELKGESYQMLDMIKEKSLQMKNLIGEILKTAKSEKMVKEHVDLDPLISGIISDLAPPPSIEIDIQNNLPLVYFHKVSLMQIFQNLLQNSIKYMDKERGLIQIGFTEARTHYNFWIKDNGPGIREKDRERIFNMFEQTSNKTTAESTGIGLSVVKKIINDNNGKIWIESEKGNGTSVFFTIPKFS